MGLAAGSIPISPIRIGNRLQTRLPQEALRARSSEVDFPRDIRISRPQQDYRLNLSITKLTLNAEIPPDRFNLAQPPGTELTRVGQDQAQTLPPNRVQRQPEDRN